MNTNRLIPSTQQTRVTRTLWRIETYLARPLALAMLAEMEGVSPFHLSRAFTLCTGRPVMRYVRARRLSEAVWSLRETEKPIVEIALEAGFESHEGFSRAFRDHFGCSPSVARNHPDLSLTLEKALIMSNPAPTPVTPRFVDRGATRLVGVARRYSMAERAKIPAQWIEAIDEIGPAIYNTETYGACYDFEGENFTYMVGLVDDGRIDTERFDHVELAAGTHAVFDHEGHISTIADTWASIFDAWAPGADVALREGPEFELYSVDFDPEKPGGASIWIPIEKA
ncbi:MAG: AraC family transcriptional regulator [Paracoccaceae bacterium]|nr:AraC family transcriptional regulator [Paracoccaceae bacterium]